MIVYLLQEYGDDYHGSRTEGVYSSKSLAEVRMSELKDGPGCEECGFEYWYSIHTFTVEGSAS
jgi:hypothetical protein